MKKLIALCAILLASTASADVITEFGAGAKLPASTSILLQEDCHVAQVIETRPDHPDLNYRVSSCGGDDPVFIGWPVAYEWTSSSDVWSLRGGWFHFSHWFDGGGGRELHMDCICGTVTFNWTQWVKKRNGRH